MLRALGSASCDITHDIGGTICYGHWFLRLVISYTIWVGHWVLRLVRSHTRQGVPFVMGIGFCVMCFFTRDKGYDLLRALGFASSDSMYETGVRFVAGIGFCLL